MTDLPTVKELHARIARMESEKASAAMKAHEAAEQHRHALIERLKKPAGISDDELIEKAAIIVDHAVANGLTSVQVFHFPHDVCLDNGRAIHQNEPGWETTLTGVPRDLYDFWKRQLQPRGYHIRFEVISYPGGMPGEIGIILSWS